MYIYYFKQNILTSKRPIATDNATPVHLNGRFSVLTGHGSLCNCSKIVLILNSHCWIGKMKLLFPFIVYFILFFNYDVNWTLIIKYSLKYIMKKIWIVFEINYYL